MDYRCSLQSHWCITINQTCFILKWLGRIVNSKKQLPCAVCVFVYILKPGRCFLAFQFEELRCSSNQISCACLESVQSSVFDSFKINITSPSNYIKCRGLCRMIHLIVSNMQDPKRNPFLPPKYLAKLDFNHHFSNILFKINHLIRCFSMNIASPSNQSPCL